MCWIFLLAGDFPTLLFSYFQDHLLALLCTEKNISPIFDSKPFHADYVLLVIHCHQAADKADDFLRGDIFIIDITIFESFYMKLIKKT